MMLTRVRAPLRSVLATVVSPQRRVVAHLTLGLSGLSVAAALLHPKVVALAAGSIEVLGTGAAANLALVFGSLMFLREAQRGRALVKPRPSEELKPTATLSSLVE